MIQRIPQTLQVIIVNNVDDATGDAESDEINPIDADAADTKKQLGI